MIRHAIQTKEDAGTSGLEQTRIACGIGFTT